MVEAEEGLRRPRPQRGRPGRRGQGPGEEGRTRGAGSRRDRAADVLAGSASRPPGRGQGQGGKSSVGGGRRSEARAQPPSESQKPLRDWRYREPKNCSGTHVTPSRGPGRGGTMQGEATKAPAPQKPTHHSSNSVLGWGGCPCPCHPHSRGKWPWCWASPEGGRLCGVWQLSFRRWDPGGGRGRLECWPWARTPGFLFPGRELVPRGERG